MKNALFWDLMQLVVVIYYWSLGQPVCPIFTGSRITQE